MKKLILMLTLVLLCLCCAVFVLHSRTDPAQTSVPIPTTMVTAPQPAPTTTRKPLLQGWQSRDGVLYYYLDSRALTGWQNVDGLDRYFAEDGALANGWTDVEGVRCYFSPEGCPCTGWLEQDGKYYYLAENGACVTGWQEVDGLLRYFRGDGTMARGRVEIGGVNHYFTSTGVGITLVNPWNYLPEDYDPDLVALDRFANYSDMYISRACYGDLVAMLTACQQECARAVVVSSYRTQAFQTRNYQRKVREYLDQGYDQAEAERLAAKVVAVPGTSEHQLGLAVDIVDVNYPYLTEDQADMPAQQWLMAHCWEYGFVLRYPKNKTDATGILYEPWHYRYVGKELARELQALDMTLEEYMTALTQTDA